MFESIILGAVQGVAEWLPVSSEAMIVLVKTNFFQSGMPFADIISYAIFLHLGTLLAVLVYYRSTFMRLFQELMNYNSLPVPKKDYLHFIAIATTVSGIIGFILIMFTRRYESFFQNEFIINISVAIFLCITSVLLYLAESRNYTKEVPLTKKRALVTGIFQGLAAIPGISRSGSTVAGMGLIGMSKEQALELSFILSAPIVLLANIVLNYSELLSFNVHHLVALSSAFIFGFITIDMMLRLVRRIRFSYFVGIFAVLLLILSFMLSL